MRDISKIIVHASATQADWMDGYPTGTKMAEIRRWHVEDRGWSDIGYHFLIDRDGTVARGRPLERIGAHFPGAQHRKHRRVPPGRPWQRRGGRIFGAFHRGAGRRAARSAERPWRPLRRLEDQRAQPVRREGVPGLLSPTGSSRRRRRKVPPRSRP
ncbi:hypothetical protein Salmuc_03620 [Salipiger mucosus DSM 16094]|uniref:Uncharacterized protein n=1 Tax=Salipiger mucosus DSM 16094 TaxID=1123237 RepID=S9RWY4_9RHOB|nr:hypothetical protein Salmuc_03620 [Salipiger mucosus DSM 16094]